MQTPTEFARAAGISISYASEILSGARKPSQALAINIYRKTGRKFGPIENMSDALISAIAEAQGLAA